MGAEIGCHSEEGRGSEFFFTAVFTKQQCEEALPIWYEKILGSHALIVDVNTNVRRQLKCYLCSWGMKVDEASRGEEAVRLLHKAGSGQNPFDYLAKPITPQVLAKTVQKQLECSKQQNDHSMLTKTMTNEGRADESTEIFFPKELEARILDDTALAKTILKEFIKDMAGQMENLHRSVAENNVADFKRQIHKMKGAAANVGARGIQKVIEDIEHALTQDEKLAGGDMLPDYIERISQSWMAVHKEMRDYLVKE